MDSPMSGDDATAHLPGLSPSPLILPNITVTRPTPEEAPNPETPSLFPKREDSPVIKAEPLIKSEPESAESVAICQSVDADGDVTISRNESMPNENLNESVPVLEAQGVENIMEVFSITDLSVEEYASLHRNVAGITTSTSPEKHGAEPSDAEPASKRIKIEVPEHKRSERYIVEANEPLFPFLMPEEDSAKRLIIKEHALEVGMKNILETQKHLMDEIAGKEQPESSLTETLAQIDELLKKARGHEVLVGVCGGTGVGKTSLLNACLGFDELLPSGQEEASTAVPCKVSYNYDDRGDHAFRAEVFFHAEDSIAEELKDFLQAFTDRADAMEWGIYSEIEELNATIAAGIDRFSPVWQFTQRDLAQRLLAPLGQPTSQDVVAQDVVQDVAQDVVQDVAQDVAGSAPAEPESDHADDVPSTPETRQEATLAWILSLNLAAKELLSDGLRTMQSDTAMGLAKEVKRYMDSTESVHGTNEALSFAAWPLVKEVRLYVKSDLLQHGVCLVDLPGVGDINRSRDGVASHYMSRLHLNIVVGSIIRGKDTKDFNDLLNAQQQATMQLDGTLDKSHFAVVFTKIDDMQAHKYHFRSQGDRHKYDQLGKEAQGHREAANKHRQEMKSLENAVRKARRSMEKKSATPESVARTEQAINNASNAMESIKTKRDMATAQAEICRQKQVHLAIMARNRHVQSGVEQNLGKKQSFLDYRQAGSSMAAFVPPEQPTLQRMAELFMTSSRGYWEIENGKSLAGIPTKEFTGIPALKCWIRQNATLHRESYVDDILSDMRVLMELLNTWARSAAKATTAPESRLSPEQIEASIEHVHKAQLKDISKMLEDICYMIDQIDPLLDRQRVSMFFKRQIITIVAKWIRAFPDDLTNQVSMSYQTHNAVIRRHGCWKSPTTGVSYDWPQKVGQPINERLVEPWKRLQEIIEALKSKARDLVRFVWASYAKTILKSINHFHPTIDSEGAGLDKSVETSGVSLEKDLETIINELLERSMRMHHEAVGPTLEDGLRAIFVDAFNIKGKGSFKARQEFLKQMTAEQADKLFAEVWDALITLLRDYRTQAQKELRNLADKSVNEVKLALRFWLRGGYAIGAGDTISKIRYLVRTWDEEWNQPELDPDHEFNRELGIPETLSIDDLGQDHSAFSVNGVNYFDAIKSGQNGPKPHEPAYSLASALAELAKA